MALDVRRYQGPHERPDTVAGADRMGRLTRVDLVQRSADVRTIRQRASLLSLLAMCAMAALLLVPPLLHDFRDNPLNGDQSAHLLSTLSLAYDSHTLNIDRQDFERWRTVGWTDRPEYTYIQRYKDGWAAAKPYGYPLAMAPFVAVLGPVSGIALGNTLLLAALLAFGGRLLWRRFDPVTAALIFAAFFVAGYIYMYAYPVQIELAHALVVLVGFGAAYRYRESNRLAWACLSFAAMAFGVAEKPPFLVLFAPIAALMLWNERQRLGRFATLFGIGTITYAIAIVPYLVYSDGRSTSAYNGDRYQLPADPNVPAPWDGGRPGVDLPAVAGDTGGYLQRALDLSVLDWMESFAYYLVGRHTGLIVTLPFALLLVGATLARARKADSWALAILGGILCYIAFYVILFTGNYYGGGQSLGNRYFIQMSTAVLVLALVTPLRERTLRWLAAAAIGLSVLLTLPHHRAPEVAFTNILTTSAPQRLLPIEANQDYTWIFKQEWEKAGPTR